MFFLLSFVDAHDPLNPPLDLVYKIIEVEILPTIKKTRRTFAFLISKDDLRLSSRNKI